MNRNKIKSAYNKVADQLVVEWKNRNAIFHDRLDSFASCLKPGDRLLDVGCGFGRDVVFFSERGILAKGIDISDSMIEIGRAQYGEINIIESDLFRFIESEKEKYQGIWIRGVLFHYEKNELIRIFSGVRYLVEQGSLLYIQTTRRNGKIKKTISTTYETLHYYFHTKDEYLDILTKYGFTLWDDISTERDICLVFKFLSKKRN